MKNEQNVLKVRFNGFNDAWEQRKFSEFVKNVAKKNKDNLDYEPYAVTNDRGFIAQKEAHDDFGYMSDVDRSAYNIVPPKSFAYNPARINVGSLGYYEGNENVIVSSLYEVFQTEDFIDDKFLLHWLKSDAFPRWIEKLQEGSVRLYFYFDKLIQCQIMLPSLEEQKRISEFLDNLDNTITLHQRKCETLQNLKKSMLQKMFPKNGEKFPVVRFSGFTDAWEQRELGDVVDFYSGLTYSPSDVDENADTLVLRSSNVKGGEIVDADNVYVDSSVAYSENVKQGDIVVVVRNGSRALIGKHAQIKRKMDNTVIGAFMTGVRYKNSEFLNALLSTHHFEEEIEKDLGATINQITTGSFKKMTFKFPLNDEEQIAIGTYFKNLDTLITLHQRKCETLQNLKKSMLQKMFI